MGPYSRNEEINGDNNKSDNDGALSAVVLKRDVSRKRFRRLYLRRGRVCEQIVVSGADGKEINDVLYQWHG